MTSTGRRPLTGTATATATAAGTAALALGAVVLRPQIALGLVLLAVLFVPLERLWAVRRQPVLRPGWGTDAVHFLVTGAVATAATLVLVVAGAVLLRWQTHGLVEQAVAVLATLSVFSQVLLAVAIIAISRYWSHRLSHAVPLLWRFHAVHHSSERLDWLASARVHPLDLAAANAASLIPLYAVGFRGVELGVVAVLLGVLPFLDHANVRLRLPGLRWVVPNPEWHHWHHARAPVDKNFSPFPFVDVLFGTAYLPTAAWPAAYGTDTPVPSSGYLAQLAHPFRRPPTPVPF
jgi:sterol desaturase/sphingolipid hydroxylase (fatty acid hydroxylase superfamily)